MHICGRVMMQKSVCRVSVHEERVCFCAHVRISAPVKEKMIQQKLSSGIFSQNADFKLRNSDLPEMSELWKKKKVTTQNVSIENGSQLERRRIFSSFLHFAATAFCCSHCRQHRGLAHIFMTGEGWL